MGSITFVLDHKALLFMFAFHYTIAILCLNRSFSFFFFFPNCPRVLKRFMKRDREVEGRGDERGVRMKKKDVNFLKVHSH